MKNQLTLVLTALLIAPLVPLHAQQAPSWVLPELDAPRVHRVLFESEAAGCQVSCHVFTPEGYEKDKEGRFPVLYWLHGTGGGLPGISRLSEFFDRAMQEGKIPPMFVVFPNGLPASMWSDSRDGTTPIETIVIKELIPHIDASYRTIAAREGRLIEGFSMGGYGAARLGFKHPELFGAVSILAGGPLGLDFEGPRASANPAEREAILKGVFGGDLDYYRSQHPITIAEQHADAVRDNVIVRIAVGSGDSSGPLNRAYSEHLTKLKIDHTFSIAPEAGHDTLALLQGLGEANWEFYRTAFAKIRKDSSTAAPQATPSSGRQWVLPEPDAPRMQRVIFESEAAGEKVSCYVFTPETYDTDKEGRFPVLYWLHGSGGSSPDAAAQVARRYGEAMRAGKIPPMILVFPNGLPGGMWCDWKDGSVKLETMFISELMPHIDRTFRTVAAREGRIIEGFSMGGYGAARLGFKHPHLFSAVSLLGAGPLQAEFTETPRAGPGERDRLLNNVYGGDMAYFREQSPWQIVELNAEKLRSGLLIRQIVGDRDETLGFNREFKQHLDALGIPLTYRQLPGVPHNPNLVLTTLGDDNWEFYHSAFGEALKGTGI
jgi:enterochelin esterase-like enzyme